MFNPTFIKGDGSEDLKAELSFNLAATCNEMLDEEPCWSHLLKGASVKASGKLYANSRQIFAKILEQEWETVKPWVEKIPLLAPLLLLKKFEG